LNERPESFPQLLSGCHSIAHSKKFFVLLLISYVKFELYYFYLIIKLKAYSNRVSCQDAWSIYLHNLPYSPFDISNYFKEINPLA
jgi:hypothetical protein